MLGLVDIDRIKEAKTGLWRGSVKKGDDAGGNIPLGFYDSVCGGNICCHLFDFDGVVV
jgi:hypothetical protein